MIFIQIDSSLQLKQSNNTILGGENIREIKMGKISKYNGFRELAEHYNTLNAKYLGIQKT